MDGIDVGKEILRQNPGCRIIIASGEWERFKEGYVIRAVRFVTKPFGGGVQHVAGRGSH